MEVTTIPDIRERNDRPKDKQPKHQAVSIVQRQMVQRFVKELNDSANQPDRSDSAERTATEQVETTTREIVHEAVQLPRRAIQHPARRESADSSANAQLEGASCCAIRAVDREYAASAYGGYTHPTGTATAAEHTGTYTAGTGPSCLCPASHKGDRVSTTNHAGTAGGAASHSDHANGRKCTASAHERCTRPDRTETATKPPGTHSTRTGPTRPRQADKEIPRRKTGCAG